MTNLTCLYLANNLIEEITGLEKLENLDTLVLSSNFISKVDGLSGCKKLTTLSLDHNKFRNPENLAGLADTPTITILNMNNNTIENEDFAEVIKPLQALRVLRMEGNGVTRQMKNYRRRLTLMFPELRFLDDAPVTEEDRRLANAWNEGGLQAERAERILIKKEKDEQHAEHMRKFNELVEKGRQKYQEEHANKSENTNEPSNTKLKENENQNKDENVGNTPFITAIEKKIDTIINNDNDNTVEEINISANSNKITIQEVDTIENENETKTKIEEVTINEAENGDMFEDVKEYEIDEVVNDDDID